MFNETPGRNKKVPCGRKEQNYNIGGGELEAIDVAMTQIKEKYKEYSGQGRNFL